MAESSTREGLEEVRDQARPSKVNEKLEEAYQNQPLLPHILSFKVVLVSLLAAAVVAGLLYLLFKAPLYSGIMLFLVFFGTWAGYSVLSYARQSERRSSQS